MQPLETGFRNVNDVSLYYEVYGTGQPLVLIHGGGGSIQHDYQEIIPRLYSHFQLIGVDLQNHGRSGHRTIPETFEQDASDVVELLRQLGVEKATFLGFSNGGNTVLKIAQLFPECVEALVVASAFFRRDGMFDGFFEGMNHATLDDMPESLKTNFLHLTPDHSKLLNMFEKDSQRMIHFQDWDESVLRSLRAPVLFLAGDQDVVKVQHTVEMAGLVDSSRVMILPAGHGTYLMADERGQTDKELIDFVALQIVKFSNTSK